MRLFFSLLLSFGDNIINIIVIHCTDSVKSSQYVLEMGTTEFIYQRWLDSGPRSGM